MKSSRHDNTFGGSGSTTYNQGQQATYSDDLSSCDPTGFSRNSASEQGHVGSSTSSFDGSWDAQQNTPGSSFMSQEGISQLTKDLRTFSDTLNALKSVFLDDRNMLDKGLKVQAHERLGELLQVLKIVVDKYSELNSNEILAMAGVLIKLVRGFNYDDDTSDVSPEVFRAINNLAMAFSNSVSECLMGNANINPQSVMDFQTQSASYDSLDTTRSGALDSSEVQTSVSDEQDIAEVSGSEFSPSVEGIDNQLHHMDMGLDLAFDRAKILSKYLGDIITYIKKRASLEMEHAKSLSKLAHTTKSILSEQSFLPFQSLYCTSLDHERDHANKSYSAYQNILQQQFVEPLQAKKSEHDKKRKVLRDQWSKDKKRVEEAINTMKKAKQTYQLRSQEHQKAKEAAIKAEHDPYQSGQKFSSSGSSSTLGSVLSSSSSGKVDKKKKQEEDLYLKASSAENNYRASVAEANKRVKELHKNKATYLQQLRESIFYCDQTSKTVTVTFFQFQYQLFSTLPVQFQALWEDAKRYEPGYQYFDYVRNLPAQPSQGPTRFSFEPFAQEGSSYIAHDGRSNESDEQRSHRHRKGLSDTESSSSRSLDDISPSASPGVLTRPGDGRRHSTEGSLSSEEILDDAKESKTSASGLSSQDAPGRSFTKNAFKVAANVKVAFMGKKASKSSLFGVDFSVAAQNYVDGIPYLVKRCVAEIDNRALSAKGLYRVNGVKNRVEKLCQQFDQAQDRIDLAQQSPHDITGVLKLFLRQLPEPLLQFRLYDTFLSIAKDYQQAINSLNEAAGQGKEEQDANTITSSEDLNSYVVRIRDAVESLPISNRNTLHYIISHLTRVSYHSSENKMTASNIAIVFGPTLLRPIMTDGNESLKTLIDMPFQSRIVEMLIIHKDFIFNAHTHQAGNIFPFSGIQQTPPPLPAGDTSGKRETRTSVDDTNAASRSSLASESKVSGTEEVLLDFKEDDHVVPSNQPNNSSSDAQYSSSGYLQSGVALAESETFFPNCVGLTHLEATTTRKQAESSHNSFLRQRPQDLTTHLDGPLLTSLDAPIANSTENRSSDATDASGNMLVNISPTFSPENSVELFMPVPKPRSKKLQRNSSSSDAVESSMSSIENDLHSPLDAGEGLSLYMKSTPKSKRNNNLTAFSTGLEKLHKTIAHDVGKRFSREPKVRSIDPMDFTSDGDLSAPTRNATLAGKTPPHPHLVPPNLPKKPNNPPAKHVRLLNFDDDDDADTLDDGSFC